MVSQQQEEQEQQQQQQETKPNHYGEDCNPKECPPFSPLRGSSCEWYKGGIRKNDCYYDYRVTGCTDLDLECSPTLFAMCDTLSQTWQLASTAAEFCPEESISQSQSQIISESESEEQQAQINISSRSHEANTSASYWTTL